MNCILFLTSIVLVAAADVDEESSSDFIEELFQSAEAFNADMLSFSNETMKGRGFFPMNSFVKHCSLSAIKSKYQIDELTSEVMQCQSILSDRMSKLTTSETTLQGLHTQKTSLKNTLSECNSALATLKNNLARAKCDVEKCLAIQKCINDRSTDFIEVKARAEANNAILSQDEARCNANLVSCNSNIDVCNINC